MTFSLISLPVFTQIVLASGYIAYCIAFMGIKSHHQTIDVIFGTLAFSLIATAVLGLGGDDVGWPYFVIAFFAPVATGVLWRKWGADTWYDLLRSFDITWSGNSPSVMDDLIGNSTYPVSEITVQLEGGTKLQCFDTRPYGDAPFGPLRMSPAGDIALYVTDIESPDGKRRKIENVKDPKWGHLLTYVPSSQVQTLNVRYNDM